MPRNQERGQLGRPHEQHYQGWQSQEREDRGRFDEERGRFERHDEGRGYHSYSRDDEGDDNTRYQQWLRSHERGQGDRSWNQSWQQDRSQPYGHEDRDWRRPQQGRGEERDWQQQRGWGQEHGRRDEQRPDRDWRGRYLGDDERERRFRDDRGGDDRGFFERAGERIRSWFSDDEDDRDRERRYGASGRSRDFASDDRDYGRGDYNDRRFGGYQDRMREDPQVRGSSRGMDERRFGPGGMMGMRRGQDRDERGRFIGDDEGYRGFGDDRPRGEVRRWGQGEHAPDRDEQRGWNVDPYDDRSPSRGSSWNRGRRY